MGMQYESENSCAHGSPCGFDAFLGKMAALGNRRDRKPRSFSNSGPCAAKTGPSGPKRASGVSAAGACVAHIAIKHSRAAMHNGVGFAK